MLSFATDAILLVAVHTYLHSLVNNLAKRLQLFLAVGEHLFPSLQIKSQTRDQPLQNQELFPFGTTPPEINEVCCVGRVEIQIEI